MFPVVIDILRETDEVASLGVIKSHGHLESLRAALNNMPVESLSECDLRLRASALTLVLAMQELNSASDAYFVLRHVTLSDDDLNQ